MINSAPKGFYAVVLNEEILCRKRGATEKPQNWSYKGSVSLKVKTGKSKGWGTSVRMIYEALLLDWQ